MKRKLIDVEVMIVSLSTVVIAALVIGIVSELFA